MDFNHVPADVRWAIANWPQDAERGAVTRFCERHQISRAVFYKIRGQALEVGPVGATEPGSRRPHHSPARIDPSVVEHALAVRAWLVEQGLDAGPLSVLARMRRQGPTPAPSRSSPTTASTSPPTHDPPRRACTTGPGPPAMAPRSRAPATTPRPGPPAPRLSLQSGSATRQANTARSGSKRWPITTRPSSSRRANVVRSGRAKVASRTSRSPR